MVKKPVFDGAIEHPRSTRSRLNGKMSLPKIHKNIGRRGAAYTSGSLYLVVFDIFIIENRFISKLTGSKLS